MKETMTNRLDRLLVKDSEFLRDLRRKRKETERRMKKARPSE
jgi:hypothetical protein